MTLRVAIVVVILIASSGGIFFSTHAFMSAIEQRRMARNHNVRYLIATSNLRAQGIRTLKMTTFVLIAILWLTEFPTDPAIRSLILMTGVSLVAIATAVDATFDYLYDRKIINRIAQHSEAG